MPPRLSWYTELTVRLLRAQGKTIDEIEDDMTEGFLLHFSTVAFVEVLEFTGILIYFRFTLKKTTIHKEIEK